MKNAMLSCTVLGLSALGLGLLNAQSTATLKADVPFGFTVGGKAMPAGACEIRTEAAPKVVTIRCEQGAAVFQFGNYREAKDRNAPARLIFNRYGDNYFLAQVWPPDGAAGVEMIPSVREKELKKSAAVRNTTIILASR